MRVEISYDNGLEAVAEMITDGISEVIAAGANAVCESAKSICPVDTGTLKSSISYEVHGDSAEISANTDYAVFVEFGTSKMAPQPYLVPSLIENTEAITNAMINAIAGI